MLRKGLMALVFAGALAGAAEAADIRVTIAPPRARVERRSVMPGRGYVWVPGFYSWDGRAYAWRAGEWQRPPHARAHWVAPRWRRHGHEWVFVEGRWR